MKNGAAHSRLVLLAAVDGKQGTRTEAQPDEDRSQKGHQRIGGAHCGQGVFTQDPADDDGVCDIVKLLQQISRHHGEGEQQKGFCDIAVCQIVKHNVDIIAVFRGKGNRIATCRQEWLVEYPDSAMWSHSGYSGHVKMTQRLDYDDGMDSFVGDMAGSIGRNIAIAEADGVWDSFGWEMEGVLRGTRVRGRRFIEKITCG